MGVGAPHTECPQKCSATINFVSVLSDEIEPVNRQILIFQSALLPLDSTQLEAARILSDEHQAVLLSCLLLAKISV